MEPCKLIVDHIELSGLMADESISGAKIVDLDLLMLPWNKPIQLEYREGKLDVRARNVFRGEDDKFTLGVVRSETLSKEQAAVSTAMLVNCYVQYEDSFVICMPIHIESESHALIQLWDGVQFRVPRSQLKALSRIERYEMLADARCLAYTKAMYGLTEETDSDRRLVFEHEFGVYEGCPIADLEPVAE